MAQARHCLALVVLIALFARPSACRMPDVFRYRLHSGSDACDTCKFTVHVLSDLLCDPYVDDSMVQWLDKYLCPQMPDKAQCMDLVSGLTPALVEWLRMNANPESMCSSMQVCGTAASLFRDPFKKAQAQAKPLRASRPNDMTCPLCMFVAAKVKEQINNPATQADIHSASLAACAQLPAGVMQDACTGFVDQYEMMYVKYLADLEPQEVCMMIGTCLDTALTRMQAQRGTPLLLLTPAALAPLSHLKGVMTAAAAVGNDHCETCKVVVQELHQVVANPQLQMQIVDYAKQACTVFPSYQDTCVADVDQYAPMAFGMILAYLQPEQVCVQLKMCPPPSLLTYVSMQTSLLGSKLAAYSIIGTSSSSSSSVAPFVVEGVEEVVPTAAESAAAARPLTGQRAVVKQEKVHGPGLVLPMAS